MVKTLTAIACRNAKPGAKRREIPDGGCRGLYFIVQKSGFKGFAARYRFRGVTRKLTLGPFLNNGGTEPGGEPTIGAPLTLASARVLATRALQQAKSGVDPGAEKRKHRLALRAVEADTLQAVAEDYLRREGPTLRSLKQRRSDLELFYRPLGRLPVAGIKRSQYRRVLDNIADDRRARADRALSALTRLLNWHASRDDDFVSPLTRGMRYVKAKELARSRTLSDDELRKLWLAAEKHPGPFGAFVRFVLLTATRRAEAAGLRRDELSEGGATWTIPASRYKSKVDIVIPLSKAAREIIAQQPVLGPYVFSTDGSKPMGGFDKRKREFDKVCKVDAYRLHDCRRTGRTLLSRAGVPVDIAEKCLGHVSTGVRHTYDRWQFRDEKAEAFESLAQMIEQIVRPKAKVSVLGEARAKRRARQ